MHRKKSENVERAPKTIESWMPIKELALARAWLDVSEDLIISTDQDIAVFWRHIREKFFNTMARGESRTLDSFSGKWTVMRTKISNFNNIYNSHANNHTRRSGSNDLDIMTAAHNEYRLYHGHPFTMIPSWELLRKSLKCDLVLPFDRTAHSSKRSKSTTTSESSESDARTTINLNDELDGLNFEEP
ncbi:glutathione S-transferase T3-like [Helianthus annuus]|uniref:glutathione S-transferase T3-like n=1 Tax=Helianthus annuus TaxID=4232 RepID=UPI000B908639|nr:glutathione S-transferase T3-like [Helianthus annuus]